MGVTFGRPLASGAETDAAGFAFTTGATLEGVCCGGGFLTMPRLIGVTGFADGWDCGTLTFALFCGFHGFLTCDGVLNGAGGPVAGLATGLFFR